MKKLAQITYIAIVMITVASCETTELNLVENPNTIRPSEANPQFLLNTMQLDYIRFIEQNQDVNSRFTRINPMFTYQEQNGIYLKYFAYENGSTQIEDNDLINSWNIFYQNMIPNFNLLQKNARAESNGIYNFSIALANIIKAHCASVLVDQYANIPYSEAGQLLVFPNPKLDDGASVYAACFDLLDEAISILQDDPINTTIDDLFYGGDSQKWLRFANSLKLRMYTNTGNTSAFNAIISSGDFISSTDQDMQFQYIPGVTPNDMIGDYPSTAGNLPKPKSNWLMGTMYDLNDPRLPYYFYRQTNQTPGIDVAANSTALPCSDDIAPAHYTGNYYCAVPQGYIGRSHGSFMEVQGDARPGNSILTLYGVYPFGGLFDDGRFQVASQSNISGVIGSLRLGKLQILTAFDVDFWRGQMATSATEKATFLRSAMEKQIAKVQTFGALDPSANLSTAPNSAAVTSYINGVIDDFMNASTMGQENIFAEQYFIALFGHGIESYNYYRKTGYPTSLAPSWNPNPGPFPRTFPYPAKELFNLNIPQENRPLTDQVFWDTNPPSPTFPQAN